MNRIPFNPATDNNLQQPEVGDFVAYNWSGQIATGWIKSIGRGRNGPIFKIQMLRPMDGHQSTVRGGPKCVLVLEKAEEQDV